MEELNERIEQLEKKVADLERQLQEQPVTIIMKLDETEFGRTVIKAVNQYQKMNSGYL